MRKIFLIIVLLSSIHSFAQLPETQVYLFDVQKSPKGYTVANPKLISKKTGYNNQPYFTPDANYLFYVSSIDTVNTEIYKIDLTKKKLRSKRITRTPEPEYSPKYTPDMENISCVRVEKDKTTQHFYIYNKKGKKPLIILPELKSIGYYDWVSQNEYISFELPEPFYLVKHTINSNTKDTLLTNIGRTFYYQRNKSKFIYIDKSDSTKWFIKSINSENLKSAKLKDGKNCISLTETFPNEEDYCFLMDGSILMGHEGILYIKKNPFKNTNSKWETFADLRKFGINQFYRIAISVDNTKLAVVAFKGKKP